MVLLDLMLPEVDGIDLMVEIRAAADVPVILVSAYGQDQLVARAFNMGADDYVVKPFSPAELGARFRGGPPAQGRPLNLRCPTSWETW